VMAHDGVRVPSPIYAGIYQFIIVA